MDTQQLWLLFGVGFTAAFLCTPLFIKLAGRWGIVDRPAHRKIHRQPVAYLGGLVLFTAFGTALCLYLLFHWNNRLSIPYKSLSIYITSMGLVALGLFDDIYGLRARNKFIGQLCFAALFAVAGFRFEILHIPGLTPYILPAFVAIPLTVFWILSLINAFNMVDGVDGLASSVGTVSLLMIAGAAALLGNGLQTGTALAMVGALLGFLVFNWNPARIYLGDSGSGGLGMFVAASLLALGKTTPLFMRDKLSEPASQPFFYQILILTLLVAYPALEITLSVARRFFHGKPLARADQGHIHHRLLKKGWSPRGIVVLAVTVSLLSGLAAIATLLKEHGLAVWFLALSALGLGLGLSFLGFLDFLMPHSIVRSRPHFQIANHFIEMQKLKLQQAGDFAEVMTLLGETCNEFGVQGYRLMITPNENGKEGCHCSWQRPPMEHQEHLRYLKTVEADPNMVSFSDHAAIEQGRGEAFWIFEPHSLEEELDVEYRVLVHEFMTWTLKKIDSLKPEKRVMDPNIILILPSRGKVLSSSFFRRRASPRRLPVSAEHD